MAPLEDTLQHIISIYDNGCQAGFERTLYAYPFYEPCLFVSLFQLTERQWKTNGILYFLFFMQGFMWISKQGNWMLQLLFSWAMIPWTLTTCTSIYHFTAHLPVRKKKKERRFQFRNLFGKILVEQSVEQRSVNSGAEIHKLQVCIKRRTVHRIISANIWRRKVRIMMICEMKI